MEKGIFITATGTDIGKTYISALLVKQLREANINCNYFKPVLSGAIEHNSELVAGDAKFVLDLAQIKENPQEHVSYLFKNAVSPHLASKLENKNIKLDKIITDYKKISGKSDFVIVEGAGGIICPLNIEENLFIYDIPKTLNLSSIIVADASLGTINTTFLTVDFMKRNDLKIKGIILNNFDKNNFMHQNNLETIEKICNVKVIGTVKKDALTIDFIPKALEGLYE